MINLKVLSTSGTELEQKQARKVLSLLERGRHWVRLPFHFQRQSWLSALIDATRTFLAGSLRFASQQCEFQHTDQFIVFTKQLIQRASCRLQSVGDPDAPLLDQSQLTPCLVKTSLCQFSSVHEPTVFLSGLRIMLKSLVTQTKSWAAAPQPSSCPLLRVSSLTCLLCCCCF